jgi:hypothetical protein
MGQGLLEVIRLCALSVNPPRYHKHLHLNSIIMGKKSDRSLRTHKTKEGSFGYGWHWTQIQIEIVPLFEVLILHFVSSSLKTHEHKGLLTVHGISNIPMTEIPTVGPLIVTEYLKQCQVLIKFRQKRSKWEVKQYILRNGQITHSFGNKK